MFKKNVLLKLMVITIFIGCACVGYEHAQMRIECNRLNALLETTLAEKALLQALINNYTVKESTPLNSGWISPSTLD